MDLVVRAYRFSRPFPKEEVYGLRAQVRKAAVSIPANIAEGHGREHLGDYIHHLSVANGSLMELETHYLIAERLKYVAHDDVIPILSHTSDVGRMLSGLVSSLKRRRTPNT